MQTRCTFSLCVCYLKLLIKLHWLPVAARTKFKSLMLAYRVLAGSAPLYLNALVRANVTPRTLRSSSLRRLALTSVQARQSRLFSLVVPRWWNELPSTTQGRPSLPSRKLLKTQLFREHLPFLNWHLDLWCLTCTSAVTFLHLFFLSMS